MAKFQTFNDGIVGIMEEKHSPNNGNRPAVTLSPLFYLRFEERKVGMTRFLEGMKNDIQIKRVIRIPHTAVTTEHKAVIDGVHYRILQVDKALDTLAPCLDLTLGVVK